MIDFAAIWPDARKLYRQKQGAVTIKMLVDGLGITKSFAWALKVALDNQSVIAGRKDGGDKPVLVFSDTHGPYQHRSALEFLQDTYVTHGCGSVVCAGDLLDFHAMSRFTSEPDSPSPELEYQKALEWSASINKAFPKGVLVMGNHDAIPQRQLQTIGVAPSLLKERNELFGLDDGWKVEPLYHTIFNGQVLIEHGIGSGGLYGAINTAIAKRSSFCQGHTHSYAMVAYRSNYKDTIFGMNCGCLFDEDSLAARYGQYTKWKGVLGCGIVYAPDHAEFIPLGGR